MRALGRYTVANAVTRAMLPQFLTRQAMDGIVRVGSVAEAWESLAKTAFGDWIPSYAGQDALQLEALLHKATALRFVKAIRPLEGKPGVAGSILLSRWDLDALVFALRLWHGKSPRIAELGQFGAFAEELPFASIARAETLEEIAVLLAKTPYGAVLRACQGQYGTHDSLLAVETALERDYYVRLLSALHALGGDDAHSAETMVSAEIDVLNLAAVSRLLNYRHVQFDSVAAYLVPGPGLMSRGLARAGITVDAITAGQGHVLEVLGEPDSGKLSQVERIALLERFTYEEMARRARKALVGFPFSISTTLAFYLLSRIELRNLRALFAAKAFGLSEAITESRLYGLR